MDDTLSALRGATKNNQAVDGLNAIYTITGTPYQLALRSHNAQGAVASAALLAAFEKALNSHAEELAEARLHERQVRFFIQKLTQGGDRHMLTLRVPVGVRVKDVFHKKSVCDVTLCENICDGHIYRLNQKVKNSRFNW